MLHLITSLRLGDLTDFYEQAGPRISAGIFVAPVPFGGLSLWWKKDFAMKKYHYNFNLIFMPLESCHSYIYIDM